MESSCWQHEIETMEPHALRAMQLERLNAVLARAAKSPYYGKLFSQNGLGRIGSLDEFSRYPFTGKQDLRDNFPYGFLTGSLDETVRLHSSSGTTGIPTVVFYTPEDLDVWTECVTRSMYMTGARKCDVFQNMMGYGLFTGGIGFHYGAERLGMLTIPSGPGNSKRQIWFMKTFRTSVMHILPSYALHLMTYFPEEGIDPRRDLALKIAFIGAEPHSEGVRTKIEEFYGIKAYNSYGLSEMCGPGVAFECPAQEGLHVWEDHFYPEIINPETGEVLPDGEDGELVLTTLTKTAMPLIRYRTRDLTRILPGICSCGRTHRRIQRITGRSDDMLIINGVNIFPVQIEKVLMTIPEIGNNYLIEIVKENFMDRIIVKVEIKPEAFGGRLEQLSALQHRIADALHTDLVVSPVVKLVEPGSLPVAEGKAKRVNDLRNA
ncbi:MAG TPA: phenylacetate--CoA ligase [Spirochaetota bacterium]|nr:phenylacetate--CoA ligase [Spirochaetota bacterium]